jgi:tripartite-type tricarboxylate transporter receptor subunit TctC
MATPRITARRRRARRAGSPRRRGPGLAGARITLVNPVAAGGSNELVKAIVHRPRRRRARRPIVMESRSGAGGTIGAAYVAKAAPDGYTLLLAGTSVTVTNPAAARTCPRSAARLHADRHPDQHRGAADRPQGLAPRPNREGSSSSSRVRGPASSTTARTVAGPRTSSGSRCFKRAAGIDVVNVPYRGKRAAAARAALRRKSTRRSSIRRRSCPSSPTERFRILGIASAERSRLFPDVPDADRARLPGHDRRQLDAWPGPRGCRPAIVDRLNAEVNKALRAARGSPSASSTSAYEPAGGTREAASAWIRTELERWRARAARHRLREPD